jgi:hypothetical protein
MWGKGNKTSMKYPTVFNVAIFWFGILFIATVS